MKYFLTISILLISISAFSANEIMNISITDDYDYNYVINIKVKPLLTTVITLNNIDSKNVRSTISALFSKKTNKKIQQYSIDQKPISDLSTIIYLISGQSDLQSTNLSITFVENNLTKVLIINLQPVNDYPTYAVNITREHILSKPITPTITEATKPQLDKLLNTNFFTWKKDYLMTKTPDVNPIEINPTIMSLHTDYLVMHFLFKCQTDNCLPDQIFQSFSFNDIKADFSYNNNIYCDHNTYTKDQTAHCVIYHEFIIPFNNPLYLKPIIITLRDGTKYKYE